jgi:hypothetical protein
VKLDAPGQVTWLISLILLIVGIIVGMISVPVLSGLGLWIVVVGHVLLLVANVVSDL